jgi:ribose transport system ATP-binding protein
LLEAKGIRKSYGGVPALNEAHLTVAAGEIHGLVGENGAGKSTLARILAGEAARDGGEIAWMGHPVHIASRHDAERLGINLIHQELNLAPHLTVADNIFLGHEPRRAPGLLDRPRELRIARQCLDRLGFDLDPRAQVRRLRPAQRQLVEIARAVARSAKTHLVIMDEPTSSLSAREVDELFAVVRQVQLQGTAVIFVTHRMEELAQVADRVTVLRDGETVSEGPMPRSDFTGLIRAMVGRELRDFFPARERCPGEVLLRVERLSRKPDFADVSLMVRAGEIVGLAGVIGAGRTEVVETIFGALPADGGRIFVGNQEVRVRHPQDAIRHGMALLTEDRKRTGIASNLPVAQNITMANLVATLRAGRIDLIEEERVARTFMDRLQIRARSVRQLAGRLSGGNQQKVVLAKWLFRDPRILLFDEPTRGVDIAAKSEIYCTMNQLAQSGAAILMVSSELPEILGMTDRVLVMRAGRIVKELVTAQTTQEEIIKWATLGASQPAA